MEKALSIVEARTELLRLTTQIVSSHIGKNQVEVDALPALIDTVYRSLATEIMAPRVPVSAPLVPAVPIRKSVFPDYIICLEDGIKIKTLKRRLQVRYGMTPQQYRQKWGLPASYPMVAQNYSTYRSVLAKQRQSGRKAKDPKQTNPPELREEPELPVHTSVTRSRARRARPTQ